MEFWDVVRRQHMTRRFEDRAPATDLIDRILIGALKAPTAGNTQGVSLIVLERERAEMFWNVTRPKNRAPRPKMPPVVVLPTVSKLAYLTRYGEPDKVNTGRHIDKSWPQPYWLIDCASATMTILLAAEGLGCWFFGIYASEQRLRATLDIPAEQELIGEIGLGYAAARQQRSPSLARTPKPLGQFIRRGVW